MLEENIHNLTMVERCTRHMGLGSMINVLNGDSITNTQRMKLSFINLQAIGLLEVQNPNNTVHLWVPRLESTRGPRKNGDGEKYHYSKNS